MRHAIENLFRGFAVLVLAGVVNAAGVGGTYVQDGGDSLTLRLEEAQDGTIRGTLAGPGMTVPLHGKKQGDGWAGTIGEGDAAMPFTAAAKDGGLVLDMDGERATFRRAGAATAETSPAPAGKRNVVINGKRWTDEDLARVEAAYRVRIADADYWYDPVLGAWGVRGSPTLGFLQPGLDLGAVAPDASGRGTNVFVNGRELHPYDVAALQRLTGPIPPGRYFITAQGLAGYEGGAPQWNLGAMMQQAQSTGGGSTSWQSRMSSGISDGETSAVFLPNGGIVSTGP